MPDKLTDSEIVKALECCCGDNGCFGCPYTENHSCRLLRNPIKDALDLINRLQAENERLKGHQKDGFFNLLGNCLVFSKTLKDYNDMRKGLKAEAYKEFAKMLNNKGMFPHEINDDYAVGLETVNNLLEELVGE